MLVWACRGYVRVALEAWAARCHKRLEIDKFSYWHCEGPKSLLGRSGPKKGPKSQILLLEL